MAIREATKDSFAGLVSRGVCVVDFFSDDCLPCKLMVKVLEDVDFDMPFLNIGKVNASKYATLGRSLKIMAYPTVLFYKDGTEMDRHIGFIDADSIKRKAACLLYEGRRPGENGESK